MKQTEVWGIKYGEGPDDEEGVEQKSNSVPFHLCKCHSVLLLLHALVPPSPDRSRVKPFCKQTIQFLTPVAQEGLHTFVRLI